MDKQGERTHRSLKTIVPVEVYEQVREIAFKQRISQCEFMRRALDKELKEITR